MKEHVRDKPTNIRPAAARVQGTGSRLRRAFYRRDARLVARELLGSILVTTIDGTRTSGRIIETEAYLQSGDEASHAARGATRRNRSMFLDGGHAYVYLIYGMHYCFNVVCGVEGAGNAVLVRAVEPLDGLEPMRRRRSARSGRTPELRDLVNGPGKLAEAFAIGPTIDGADLIDDPRIWIEPGDAVAEHRIAATPRIGISRATDHLWRFVLRDDG